MQKTIIGVFDDRVDAEEAIETLKIGDYNPSDISIVMQEEVLTDGKNSNLVDGAAAGVTSGAVIGGLTGLLVGIGALAIPGIGALLIGGPLAVALGLTGAAAATFSGAATGALTGGLLGALIGLGIPEEEARIYEERIKTGGILVAVQARMGEEEEVYMILEDGGADSIRSLALKPTHPYLDAEYPEDEMLDGDAADYINVQRDMNRPYSQPVMRSVGAKGGRSKSSKRVSAQKKT